MIEHPLVTFLWQGKMVHGGHWLVIPRTGDFVEFRLGEEETYWRVCSVHWTYRWERGIGDLRPEVDVHLRRLHHASEWGNRHEPTGYSYVEGIDLGEEA